MYSIVEKEGAEIIKRDNADGTTSWIPKDEANSDYQAYVRWLNGEDEAQSLQIVATSSTTWTRG